MTAVSAAAERLPAAERLVVALDLETLGSAETMLDRLRDAVSGCKIGTQLFTAAGPAAVEAARQRGFRVFLDLKYHDIPNTVAAAVREATRLGVFMLTVHASGGRLAMRAAAEAATKAAADFRRDRPLCLGVTVLTSLDRRTLEQEVGVPSSVTAHVLRLATLARDAGLDGCVASPHEIQPLRLALGRHWVIVTPGIRLSGPAQDQVRTATAAAAVRAGADYLVVGRPILQAEDPVAMAKTIVRDMEGP